MAKENLRETILETCADLYAASGYAEISMRNVADKVGVTVANLYYYFPSKESLIKETLTHVFSQKMAPLEGVLKKASTVDDRFEIFIRWFVDLVFKDKIFTRLLSRELLDGNGARIDYLAEMVFDQPFALMKNLVIEYTGASDSSLVAGSILGVILGHYQLAKPLDRLSKSKNKHSSAKKIADHVLSLAKAAFPPATRKW